MLKTHELLNKLYSVSSADFGSDTVYYRLGYMDGVRKNPKFNALGACKNDFMEEMYTMGYEDGKADIEV